MKAKSLDHFLLLVHQLEDAAARYRRLGFQVRPIADHLELGSKNCVLHFANTYLELFWFRGEIEALKPYVDRFQCGEGMAHVSLTSEDLVSEQQRVRSQGLSPGPIMSARRKIVMPNGEVDETASSCFYVWREDAKYLSLFYSGHGKPETIFIPAYEQHDNTTIDVSRLVYLSADPQADVDYFTRSFGHAPATQDSTGFSMRGSRGDITEVLTPKAAVARYGAHLPCTDPAPLAGFAVVMHLAVRDLEQCRRALQAGEVAFEEWNGGVIVSASQACGCTLVFEVTGDPAE